MMRTPEDYSAAGIRWTVVRGVAYDMTVFLASGAHPGGDALARLAVGRDSTALIETNHLRQARPFALLKTLPILADFPVEQVEQAPRPSDSALYSAIRQRVVAEVFGGAPRFGAGKGGEQQAVVASVLLLATGALWMYMPGVLTGLMMGLAAAFAAMVSFHAGNHGALSSSATINGVLAHTGDLLGASSLPWRYKHQVSHHIYTGDHALDSDLMSPYPRLRFDDRLPKKAAHRFQYLYMWALFPLMYIAFFTNNWMSLFSGKMVPVRMLGAVVRERALACVLQLVHLWLLFVHPLRLAAASSSAGVSGGPTTGGVLLGALVYATSLSFVLAVIFAVSHNTPGSKKLFPADAAGKAGSATATVSAGSCDLSDDLDGGSVDMNAAVGGGLSSASDNASDGSCASDSEGDVAADVAARAALHAAPVKAVVLGEEGNTLADWGKAQIYHSANWGGSWANYWTGGLSLQIEHHLFPAVFPGHYPAISVIVAEECAAHGVEYKRYDRFWDIAGLFVDATRNLGAPAAVHA